MTRTIEVLITPNGETKLETKGFTGAGCQAASEFLEATLGCKTRDERTAEFYQTAVNAPSVQERGASA